MHDVIREYLREELGDTRLKQLHRVLLDTVADGLPVPAAAEPRDPDGGLIAWWMLPMSARYLWDHLIEHMLAAGRARLGWPARRGSAVGRGAAPASGPAGPYADLALIGTLQAERLGRVLGQAAHLLAPTDPPHSLIDILYSRVSHDPEWGAQAKGPNRRPLTLPALINKWPLPDLPAPCTAPHPHRPHRLRDLGGDRPGRHLARHRRARTRRCGSGIRPPASSAPSSPATPAAVTAVAIAPDGTWLATAEPGQDGADLGPGHRPAARRPRRPHRRRSRRWRSPRTAPGWPPPAGTGRCGSGTRPPASSAPSSPATPRAVRAVAIAPGRHLACHRQRATGRCGSGTRPPAAARRPRRPRQPVTAVAIAPDGTWLASADEDGIGADLGPGHRPAARRPHRPRRRGHGGGDRPGRHLAGHRQPGRDGADLGSGHRPAARRLDRPRRAR